MSGMSFVRHIVRRDGVSGVFRGFGTSAIRALPSRVLVLTSFELSKDMMFKYTQGIDMPDTRVSIANGVVGMLSNLFPLSSMCLWMWYVNFCFLSSLCTTFIDFTFCFLKSFLHGKIRDY